MAFLVICSMYIHSQMDIFNADGSILWHFGYRYAVCIFIPTWIFFMRMVTFYGVLGYMQYVYSFPHGIFFMRMVTFYGILFICIKYIHSHMDMFHAKMWIIGKHFFAHFWSRNVYFVKIS